MKNYQKRAALLIALLTVASALAACASEPGDSPSESQTQTSAVTTAAITTTELARENTPDSLPKDLDFKGAKVRLIYRGDDVTRKFETEGEDTGDVVSDAVYARNRSIEERLNVKYSFIKGNEDHTKYMNELRTALLAADDNYDIIDAIQWLALPQSTQGLYYNLADAPYIDYSQPWWANDYMNEISVHDDVKYCITGDVSVYQLRMMSCMYFNKRIFEGSFGKSADLYKTVLDGNWTYELLSKYVKEIYSDANGDGKTNADDVLGISTTPVSQTDHFTYTAGVKYSTRDNDGYPILVTDQSRNVKFVETLYDLYYNNPGTLIYPAAGAMDKECINHFIEGEALFYPNRFYSTDYFREMEDEYGVIPFPKLDDKQEDYYALIHDSTTLFCIPVTLKNIEMSCAVIEAMAAENYRTVTPAYYEIALKVKYTRDDVSVQIIDMIHSNARTDFMYANNYSLNASGSLGTLTRNLMGMGGTATKDYMSAYSKLEPAVKASLETLIKQAKETAK